MTSTGVVYIDAGKPYNLKVPGNWRVHYEPEHRGLQGSMQWVFENFPGASQYGWLADDTRPRTPGWDKLLEEAAGDWCLSYAADGWLSELPLESQELADGHNLSAGLCWGGVLVRTVGWWALPGVFQAGIDTAWTALVRPWNQHRYLPNVVVEHLHWKSGKRDPDQVDQGAWIDADLAAKDRWMWSREYRDALIAVGHGQTLYDVRQLMRMSRINERYVYDNGGIPQARLHRMLEGVHPVFDLDANQEPRSLDPPVRAVRDEPNPPGLGMDRLRRQRAVDQALAARRPEDQIPARPACRALG